MAIWDESPPGEGYMGMKGEVNRLPLGMSPLPTWEGIRGEATVDDGHVGLVVWITEIGEVRP